MARAFHLSLAAMLASLMVLAGCEDGKNPFTSSPDADAAATEPGAADKTIEREVEAPDIFAAEEDGLWDGRPSLGGMWIAHPDAVNPERVRVTNATNGNATEAALFRRDRDQPGPRIQVSSDLAEALGILAGQPTKLKVVALKREKIEIPAAPPPEGAAETGAEAGATDLATATGGAIEAKSLDAPVEAPKAKGAAAKTATAEAAPAPSTPKRALNEEAIAMAEAAIAGAAPKAAGKSAKTAAAAQAPAATEKPASKLLKPFIQIGVFSEEANAQSAAGALRKEGMIPTIKTRKSGGKSIWRVLVGPASDAKERGILLSQLKELGYADAYSVTN